VESKTGKTSSGSEAQSEESRSQKERSRSSRHTVTDSASPAAVHLRALHPTAREMLTRVLTATKHELTLDDFGELLNAHELATRLAAKSVDDVGLMSLPVMAGDVVLYPLTIGVAQWLEDHCDEWYDADDGFAIMCASAFALSFGPERHDELLSISVQSRFERQLRRWRRKRSITAEDLADAVQSCVPTPRAQAQRSATSYSELIGLLVREYGNEPSYWMWKAPLALCSVMIDDFIAKQYRDADANLNTSKKVGSKTVRTQAIAQRKLAEIKEMRTLEQRLHALWLAQ
jgi:hypothetical protein